MRRRYASSKFRIALFLLLMAGAMFAATAGKAQPSAGATRAPAAGTQHTGLFQVIMSNKDPVFFLIMACSVAGVTLIIQGFIKNRRDVLMPEQSIQHIRELINQRQFKELI